MRGVKILARIAKARKASRRSNKRYTVDRKTGKYWQRKSHLPFKLKSKTKYRRYAK